MNEGVVFIYDEFNELYPELNATRTKAKWAFDMACLILNNTSRSIVCCECERKKLLYLLTAHIMFLQNRGMGNTGAISNAHEGSVSVGYSNMGRLSQDYLGQSQYGVLFWQLVAKYLSGFYIQEC